MWPALPWPEDALIRTELAVLCGSIHPHAGQGQDIQNFLHTNAEPCFLVHRMWPTLRHMCPNLKTVTFWEHESTLPLNVITSHTSGHSRREITRFRNISRKPVYSSEHPQLWAGMNMWALGEPPTNHQNRVQIRGFGTQRSQSDRQNGSPWPPVARSISIH